MKKNGFTLMELMVYIALLGVVVLIAGQAFKDSSLFRIRSQNMLKASESLGNISSLLREDLAQMGAKAWKLPNAEEFKVDSTVFMEISGSVILDSSSYVLENNGTSLTFRRLDYLADGSANFVQEIRWWTDADKNLYRSCKTLKKLGTSDPDLTCPTEEPYSILMAKGVSVTFVPGSRISESREKVCTGDDCFISSDGTSGSEFSFAMRTDLPYFALSIINNGVSSTISGFQTNYQNEAAKYASQIFLIDGNPTNPKLARECKKFKLKRNKTYALEFKMPVENSTAQVNYMRNFRPGYDHISVGFRRVEGTNFSEVPGLKDFSVYPTFGSWQYPRYQEFTLSGDKDYDACLAFTFSLYSPDAHMGWLDISDIQLYERTSEGLDFANASPLKKNVKAFKVHLSIEEKGESGTLEMIVQTPNNGVLAAGL